MLHEYASDTHFFEGLVEVVLDVGSDHLLNVLDEEVVRGDVVRLVGHLRRLAVQAERRLLEHALRGRHTREQVLPAGDVGQWQGQDLVLEALRGVELI